MGSCSGRADEGKKCVDALNQFTFHFCFPKNLLNNVKPIVSLKKFKK
jgi:hypothetical protein